MTRKAFCNEAIRVIWQYLGSKWQLPVSRQNKEQITQIFAEKDAPDDLRDETIELLRKLERSIYAPAISGSSSRELFEELNPGSLIWKNGRHEKWILSIVVLTTLQATAQDSLWQAANIAYEQGFYKNADSLYTILLNDHGPSAEVYYNLGNTCYKQEDWPRAILNYERCLQIDRRHKDAIFNLELSTPICVIASIR